MMESCSRSKLKLENHNDRPRLASHWGYNFSIGFDLFCLTFKWHIYHWSILYSPTVWWKKFAAVLWYSPHADDGIEQLGPRLFSIWGNIFPFSVMGGSLERWQCCVLREVPLPHGLRPQTPFLCVGKAQTSVAYLCAAPAPPGRDHTHKCGSHMRFWEAKVSLNFINEGI